MKDPRLWVSNRNGNAFIVSASERYINQLTRTYDGGVRVKRLAASDWCAWAVGHDHRVYVFVLPSDVPIRVPETTYENQRWSPFNGFRSSNLLPTDRRAWSDERGDVYLPKESIRLPSAHWDWEGEWFIDENLQGEICTDRGGWQYSINFTGRWSSESSWNSCVRKRKWIRFCRYTATNTWAVVSDMEVVEKSECFIDIAVGGQLLPGQPPDFLSVWAITNNGQVYVRTGVCRECPEGKDWMHVPGHCMGIINIACGPTGLVWAVTWDGHALVRTHVSRDHVYGVGWETVPYPQESTRLMQVAVGRNSVWGLSRDGKVWFRQGVNGDKLFWDATAATGNGWVMMVGEMIHIAVSGNDQVFALGMDDEDKEIWFRTGVTASEPGGKTWQRVILEENPEVFDPISPKCLLSCPSQPSLDSADDAFTMSDCFSASPVNSVNTRLEDTVSVPMMSLISSAVVSDSPQKLSYDETPIISVGSFEKVTHKTNDADLSSVPVKVASSVTRERTKSWLMIENSIHTHNSETPNSVEESGESLPCIPSTDSEFAAISTESKYSVSKDHSEQSVPMVSLSEHESVNSLHTNQDSQISEETPTLKLSNNHGETTPSGGPHSHMSSLDPEADTHAQADTHALTSSLTLDRVDSLDSGPSSDIICNFVTDLIDDEDEKENDNLKLNNAVASINLDDSVKDGDSQSKLTNNTGRVCLDNNEKENKPKPKTSAASVSSDNGQVTFQDMHDQGEMGDSVSHQPTSMAWISLGPSETFTGRAVRNSTPAQADSIPAMTMSPAQPRYAWGWIAAGDFIVENPASVPWLSVSKGTVTPVNYHIPKVSRVIREGILQQLKQRNQKEINNFSHYNHAVEKSSWVKKAAMKVQWPGRGGHWYDCCLEMEQGLGEEMDATITLQFKLKHKPKVLQMSLQEIRCVKMSDDHHLAVYNCDPDSCISPLMLQTNSEADLREWLGIVNMANLSMWQLNHPITPGSVCSVTIPGHIFIHSPDVTRAKASEMMWCQHGGHMALIETSPCGVTWALSFDHSLWVYNGGYGNALTRELSEMACDLREQVDYRTIRVLENQKWFPVVGYCSRGVLHNNFAWTTPKGQFVKSREDIKLPSSHWQWVSDWTVDFTTAGGVSNDGWQYSSNFHRPYHPHQSLRDSVRRRQWSRKCKLVTQGPWVSPGPPELIDLSLQVDVCSSPSTPLVVWAIGANGDVLCRSEVTQAHPMGKSWVHIATTSDMAFRSVSVGGGYRVWAVAADGSVWYRPGVTPYKPAGSCWIQVIPPPPGGAMLQSISAGGSAVWAVDKGNNLWRREEITPTFPEGTRWTFVCNHVRRVSVGPRPGVDSVREQLWTQQTFSGCSVSSSGNLRGYTVWHRLGAGYRAWLALCVSTRTSISRHNESLDMSNTSFGHNGHEDSSLFFTSKWFISMQPGQQRKREENKAVPKRMTEMKKKKTGF